MSFVNELRVKSANAENVKNEVIAEIKTYFDRYLNGDGLETYLRQWINDSDIKARKVFMKVEFWEYHDGCSTTHFSCGGKCWYNPENKDGWKSHSYKGIELRTINKEIGADLSKRLVDKMNEMGFYVVSQELKPSRFGYYEVFYYFGW